MGGTIAELTPRLKKIIEAGGRSVGEYNLGGEYYAIRNLCPHQSASLCEGKGLRRLSSHRTALVKSIALNGKGGSCIAHGFFGNSILRPGRWETASSP
ncbi:Rieske 2Fe-2S domain-containing protein [Paenibacillus sp. 2RAB27]|uniref:Rieske 2Fe-2S domain-containing protein n=1 Tax=Paenibacillus sp. 2RAB27 TaxID=3232991 RepID=UPI003F9D7A7B